MPDEPLSHAVQSLLRGGINSYEKLDIVLMLRKQATWLPPDELAQGLGLSAVSVEEAVRELSEARLSRRESTTGRCLYSPQTLELGFVVDALVDAFEENPLAIIRAMSANSIDRVRSDAAKSFAAAFVWRKGKSDG